MKRQIFLPELLKIHICNYTLYPNGLDFTFDFVKGINLVLGGNGMGKTTFVNIIKFGLIGLYKKPMDLTRTYQGKAIIKRLLYPSDFFSARKDDSIRSDGESKVLLTFRVKDKMFDVTRSLDSGSLLSVSIENECLIGDVLPEDKYERLDDNQKEGYLLKRYEEAIAAASNLTFDDLIFFVNEILFFGEDHKTVLWNGNESQDGKADVQNELFNKYFNEPDLDRKRQDALRQARYYDSLSRHKSEDMRVIYGLMNKMRESPSAENGRSIIHSAEEIIGLKSQLDSVRSQLESIQNLRNMKANDISILQGEINRGSLSAAKLDDEKKRLEGAMKSSIWETVHPLYGVFVKNIQLNHMCPICNQKDDALVNRLEVHSTACFVCGREINFTSDVELVDKYKAISEKHRAAYQEIANKQRRIKTIETELDKLDNEFKEKDSIRRDIQRRVREMEYKNINDPSPDKLQTLADEYDRLLKEKEGYQKKSSEYGMVAKQLTQTIEDEILDNVSKFSSIFSNYSESFLGVKCSLEYSAYDNGPRRFYPVIDGKIRRQEESLSESQRFFIDHSFRMSILTFFYQTPSFYIVETPDSSLDISYEKNAAAVFARFLANPNTVILTSNLNNSSFVRYLIRNKEIDFALVGLPDIAKKSAIQGASEQLLTLYREIKKEI